MAQSPETNEREQVSLDGKLFLCIEPLNGPLLEIRTSTPITITLPSGAKITFPREVALYVHPNELAHNFFTSLQVIAAEAQVEEEERWLRMTPEQVETARAAYVPF